MACKVRKNKGFLDIYWRNARMISHVGWWDSGIHACVIYRSAEGARDLLHWLSRVHKTAGNACRDLHRILHRTKGVLLPLPIDVCSVRIRRRRPLRRYVVWWPILKMNSWVSYFVKQKPQMLLGGYHTNDVMQWQNMFQSFWQTYLAYNPAHPVFSSGFDLRGCVPFAIHGDEGRGLGKKQFMVVSWQTLISHRGPMVCNDST